MPNQAKQPGEATDNSPDAALRAQFQHAQQCLMQQVIGQPQLVERLLLALLADGHLLVEGAPGLAKTRAIKCLAALINADFHRLQFTPDLLPSDLTGTDIYQPHNGQFVFQPGPVFHNILLADEINRAPAKVQSALLEAMAEQQITIGRTTHKLPPLFLVMATQNPIEQEGTYPLPEAQLDRFLLHVHLGYPPATTERAVMALARNEAAAALQAAATPADNTPAAAPVLHTQQIMQARRAVLQIHLSAAMEEYIVQLVLATRQAHTYASDLAGLVEWGASPRGSIGLERAARAHAWLNGRDYVSPDDVQKLAADVLRHRILLSFTAQADGLTSDAFIDKLLSVVPVP